MKMLRKLVVLKPGNHKQGFGLSQEVRAETRTKLLRIKEAIGQPRGIIFSQDTRCAAETALLAQKTFGIEAMIIFADVLKAETPHQAKPKNRQKLLELLKIYQETFDVMILVTHIGNRRDEEIFTGFNLEEQLNWRIPVVMHFGRHEIIEYQVA